MLKFFMVLLAFTTAVYAKPSCLVTGGCFEYEGEIYDLRSSAAVELDKTRGCDPLVENCLSLMMQNQSMPVLNEKEFSSLVGDNGTQYFIPIELRSSDMMILAGALSLGTVVFANDRAIMDFVQNNKTDTTETITSFGNIMGTKTGIVPIAAGAYFVGAVMKNGKLKNVGLFTVAAGLATQIVTEAFKVTFQRERPNASESPYEFFEQSRNSSFFSGHTSGAFSVATVIATIYKDKPAVPYIAYGVAALTAYARMHDEKHWASDVLAGAVAGHLVTKIIMRTFDKNERTGSGLLIIPEFGQEYNGVRIQWRPGHKEPELQCNKYGLEGRELMRACFEEAFAQ